MTNPLLADHAVPAYDRIQKDHFLPALEARLAESRVILDGLRTDKTAPDFANAVVALEPVFDGPGSVMGIINTFELNLRDDAISAIAETARKAMDTLQKEMFQDPVLAARFKAVYDRRATLGLDAEDMQLLDGTFKSFEMNGAFLTPAAQQQIRAIDARLIELASAFEANLNKGAMQQAVHITDPAELAGVPADVVTAMREKAQEDGHAQGWTYVPERLQVDSLLCIAENREFRRKIFTALNAIGTQAPYDSRPVIQEMQKLRQERTALIGGYANYADWALNGTMAGSLARAETVLRDSAKAILPAFEKDIDTISAYAVKNGGPAMLEPWDSPYWATRYKEETFKFNEQKFSEYLELDHVVGGMFRHYEKMFNVRITENTAHPKFHADVRTYDITDAATGGLVGVMHSDIYARKGTKQGGAWMEHLQHRDDAAGKINVVGLNMNCTKPAPGQPTLLDIGTVETFYHEAGHAFHGLLGTNTKYKSAQGPGISSDFFEIHSTSQEYWAFTRELVKGYAKHFKTGATIPDILLDAQEAAGTFFKSRSLMLMIQNALRDLEFHKRNPAQYGSDQAVEKSADFPGASSKHVRAYPLTRFGHLFSDGLSSYAAGYYGYFWAELQSAAVYDTFKRNGLYDRLTADRLTAFYREGARQEPNAIFEAFNGGPASPESLLRATGIIPAKKPPAGNGPAPNGP